MPFRVDTFVVPAGKFHNPKSCVCDPSFQRLLVDGSVDLGGDHALLTASSQDGHLGWDHQYPHQTTYFLQTRTSTLFLNSDLLP